MPDSTETQYEAETVERHGPRKIEPLDQEQVARIIEAELQDSIGGIYGDSDIAEERRQALRYYYGRPLGNEIEGRSQVQLTDVADTIEWIMPSVMRMLVPNGKRAVRMKPKRNGPEAKELARKATIAVNEILMEQNEGFLLYYEWFKTALLEKNGFTKCYYEETFEPKENTYLGLDQFEADILLEDEDLEVVAWDERPEVVHGVPTKTFDITVRNSGLRSRIAVDGVPPEEMLIKRREVRLNDRTMFCAHQKQLTIGDLLSMGIDEDLVLSLPREDPSDWSTERAERFDDEEYAWMGSVDRDDVASQEVWVTECYIRIDEDGDGYSELRRILVSGYDKVTILDDQKINRLPFASLTPIPVPFKFFGRSLADLIMDLQKIRSVLLRAMMDNLFLANNPKTEVVEGQVNLDDLLVNRPGNIVRVRSPGMMREVQTPAFSPMAVQMMEFLEGVKENRTGTTRYNQGQDAKSLNQTASGLSQIMVAAAARVEMIARIFALTGMKQLAKLVYGTLRDSPMKPWESQLDDGEWMHIDPNDFNEDFEAEVVVGLGVGAQTDRVQHLQMVLELQAQMADRGYGDYLVTAENVYNASEELADVMGFDMPNAFFTNPRGQERPKPPPPEQVQVQQMKSELELARIQLEKEKAKVDGAKEAALAEHRMAELAQSKELDLRRMELESKTRIEIAEIQATATLQAASMRPKPNAGNGAAANA